jgi:hypothetical protein
VQAAVLAGEPGAADFALVEPEPVEPPGEDRRPDERPVDEPAPEEE